MTHISDNEKTKQINEKFNYRLKKKKTKNTAEKQKFIALLKLHRP